MKSWWKRAFYSEEYIGSVALASSVQNDVSTLTKGTAKAYDCLLRVKLVDSGSTGIALHGVERLITEGLGNPAA